MALLSVENLSIRFAGTAQHEDVHAVRGLSFSLDAGECVAIVGESGSGKSATARALVGLAGNNALVEADRIGLGDRDLRKLSQRDWRGIRGRHIGFVLQDALVSLDPLRTIGQEVAETIEQHRLLPRRQIRGRVVELLTGVGMADAESRLGSYAHQLSGGLRQRALIAAALSGDPQVLIADEPTTALDVVVQAQILALLQRMKQDGRAILLISHDLAVVAELADRIVVMKDGVAVETGTPAQIFTNPQADYTKALLAAIPSRVTRGRSLVTGAQIERHAPAPSQAAPALAVADVSRKFGQRLAVNTVSLTLRRGETLGIVGASGSGKTTLARLIMGLEVPEGGVVTLAGEAWSALHERQRRPLRHRIQLVSQDPMGAFDPRFTVRRILDEALEAKGLERSAWPPRRQELMASVGLSEQHLNRRPSQLSGGQRQRVAIARALAMEPEILVCDEPVSALDVSTQAQVLDLLIDLKQRLGLSIVFVSHDLGVVQHISDRVAVMNDGAIVEEGDVDQVLNAPGHPYTMALLKAQPSFPSIT